MAAQIIEPLFPDSKHGYWAMHFAAVLKCLDDHKGMKSDPHSLLSVEPGEWTLARYRGVGDVNGFKNIKGKVKNFGAQYLLADILNREEHPLSYDLIDHLSQSYDEDLLTLPIESLSWDCYVAGNDARAGEQLAERTNARLLGDRRYRAHTYDEVKNTDLCLVLKDDTNFGLRPLAVLGEVEGNKGRQLTNASFWVRKPDLAQFGIGLTRGVPGKYQITPLLFEGDTKVVVRMGHEESALADFHKAVDKVEHLMQRGPYSRWWEGYSDQALVDILDLLANGFEIEVRILIDRLREDTLVDDLNAESLGPVELLSTTPDIIMP
jgi:hypothetical protein